MQSLVPPTGPKKPFLIFIGEAPGSEEIKQGLPFVGPTGHIFSGILRTLGIKREDVYITNVYKYKLGRGKHVSQEAKNAAFSSLRAELAEIDCPVIVALGGIALEAITGKVGIENYRGSVLEALVPGKKVIPTHHPAKIMHTGTYSLRSIIEFDIRRAVEELCVDGIQRPKKTLHLRPNLQQALEYCDYLMGPSVPFVTYDVETQPGTEPEGAIVCFGFAGSGNEAMCIPLLQNGDNYWTYDEEVRLFEKLKQLFQTKPINGQNIFFDLFWSRFIGLYHKQIYMDTMLAHVLLWPDLPHSLAFLTSIYTKEPYYKSMGKSWDGDYDQFWTYNALDCITTHQVAQELTKELEESKLANYYFRFARPLSELAFRMSLRGVLVDEEYRREASKKLTTEIKEMEGRLSEAAGFDVNVNPSNSLREFLYEHLCLPKRYSKSGGNLATGKDDLLHFQKITDSPLFSFMLNIRQQKKLNSQYYNCRIHPDGRLRTTFKQTTKTGRFASSKCWDGSGANLQNFPPEARKQVIAGPGRLFVSGDLSQVDARIVAYSSQDPRLLHVFESGQDIHLTVASFIFDRDYDEIEAAYRNGDPLTKRQRTIAKTCVHALNYGMGVKEFHARLAGRGIYMALEDVKRVYMKYHQIFSGVHRWQLGIQGELSKTRRLSNVFGRYKVFMNRLDDNTFREAYAWEPQSTAAEIVNRAMLAVEPELPDGCYLVLQIHDEMVVEAREECADAVGRLIKNAMEMRLPVYDAVIPVDINIGYRWSSLK